MDYEIKKGIYAVVYKKVNNEIRYLVMRRSQDWTGWEFVKGGVESGEDFDDTAPRELKEETNLEIMLKKSKHESHFYSRKDGKQRKHVMKIYYGEYKGGEIKIGEEHDGFAFMKLEDALKILSYEDQRKILVDVDWEVKNEMH